jgi:hypothetical protein
VKRAVILSLDIYAIADKEAMVRLLVADEQDFIAEGVMSAVAACTWLDDGIRDQPRSGATRAAFGWFQELL